MSIPTVVITGAAAGIGRALAARFHQAGYLVGAYDVDAAGLASLEAELGDRIVTGLLDVRDADAWTARLAEFATHSGGRLDVLVNNAGILVSGLFSELPLDAQRRLVDVNVTGTINGCHTAYPLLAATPDAVVVNLCSASAIYGQAELATYSATKFAVRGLTEALDLEWAPDDIRVRAVWPLFVKTAMTEGLDIGSTRSLGIHLTPDDVAATVLDVVRDAQGGVRLPHGVHHPVGRQAAAAFTLSQLTPGWVLRRVNRRITGH